MSHTQLGTLTAVKTIQIRNVPDGVHATLRMLLMVAWLGAPAIFARPEAHE